MPSSVEQSIKAKFARVFVQNDWHLFKTMAEFHLERAARLLMADMKHVPPTYRLLARNAQKRLFIGVGTELILKALYLKNGFAINKPVKRGILKFPFTPVQAKAAGIPLAQDDTYILNDLIGHLSKVPAVGKLGALDRGLKIAKVFRNKEGHVVLPSHTFDQQDYRDVEQALIEIYSRGFNKTLEIRFAVAAHENAKWRLN